MDANTGTRAGQAPRISVIVPNYNGRRDLPRCLDSLLAQTLLPLEILVVDDGSTDESRAYLTARAAREPRICPLFQAQNGGVSKARNRGLAEAKGDYIAFCDSDDAYLPEAFAKLAARLEASGAELAAAQVYQGYSEGLLDRHDFEDLAEQPTNEAALLSLNSGVGGKLFRRSLIEREGLCFNEAVRLNEELSFTTLGAATARGIEIVHEPLFIYYYTAGSVSNRPRKMRFSDFECSVRDLDEALAARGVAPEVRGYLALTRRFYGEMLNRAKAGQTAAELRAARDAFRKDFPDWRQNPYRSRFGRAKNLLLDFSDRGFWPALRLLARLHSEVLRRQARKAERQADLPVPQSPRERDLLVAGELYMLRVLECFAKAHNIRYFGAYGTALGALRHRGFIPWDDDIDLCLPREDYERLCESWPREGIDGVVLQHFRREADCPTYYAKLRLLGTRYAERETAALQMEKGLFLDLFPLDPIPDDEAAARRHYRRCNRRFQLYVAKSIWRLNRRLRRPTDCLIQILRLVLHLALKPVSKARLFEGLDRAARAYEGQATTRLDVYSGSPERAYRLADLWPLQEAPFEGQTLPLPQNPLPHLEAWYGRWQELPPESERCGHRPAEVDLEAVEAYLEGEKRD